MSCDGFNSTPKVLAVPINTTAASCREHTRRELLRMGTTALAGLSIPFLAPRSAYTSQLKRAARHLEIQAIDRVTVKVPYREIPARNMARELPHWMFSEIFQVKLKSGHVGLGETLLYYTWDATEDEDVKHATGKNAAELMWDDRLGAGLQMALFDGVARAMDVPIHALLGPQVHKRTPLSWWNIDTSAEDMAAECKEAYRQGYMAYKSKGRPWYDVWDQVAKATKGVPHSFKIDLDFNDTLLDAERGIPILQDLEEYPQIDIYESPISQFDLQGNKAICAASRVAVAMHYGKPDPVLAIKEDICDGFVVGGGAKEVIDAGAVCEMADKPFWLQLVGTGITAAYSLHFGGVLSQAIWPAVNCHQLYKHSLLTEPIIVKAGYADVPDKPGLGFELDKDAVERLRIEKPKRRPDPPRIIETTWLDGRKMYFGNTGAVNFVLNPARRGKVPYFERGVTTRLWENDGSKEWRERYEQCRKEPLLVNP